MNDTLLSIYFANNVISFDDFINSLSANNTDMHFI